VWFSVIFRFLVELGRLFRCRVDISGKFRLIDSSRFFRFWFRVYTASHKALLLAIGGSK